jgi:hypothetical protein
MTSSTRCWGGVGINAFGHTQDLSHRCGAALKTVCSALAQFVGDCSNRLQPTSYGELQQERTNHSNGGKSPRTE